MTNHAGYRIVLTADRATMTDYSGADILGFLLCLPYRLVPKYLLARVLAPPIEADEQGRALVAPYPLRKIEAALYASGFSPDEVAVVPPEKLESAVGPGTALVGLHVLDPLGLAPVPHTLSSIMGGGASCTRLLFLNLMRRVLELKHRYGFKLVAGGPGTWQIRLVREKLPIDCLVHGEGELVFPELCRRVLRGEKLPPEVDGGSVPVEHIPAIRAPSRNGLIQITRGCPRRCQFCDPTMFNFRSMPIELIRAEAEVNARAGFSYIGLATEDGLLYGARGIEVNRRAVLRLASTLRALGVRAGFCHLSAASIVQGEDVLAEWAHIFGYSHAEPEFPQLGLETGSPRLIRRYMAGKPRPWGPEDWPWLVEEATHILNENALYPCYTLILGLPGEREDDVLATLELVDELKGLGCWLFPLLFVPIGRSLLRNAGFAVLERSFTPAHWELLARCIEHDLAFSRRILSLLLRGVRGSLAQRMIRSFIEMGLDAVEEAVDRLRSDPLGLLEQASTLNIFSAGLRQTAVFLKTFIIRKSLAHARA